VGRLREVGRKFDRWIDVVMMQRAVQPTGEAPDATAFRAL
jgi:L-amino acid N-acyltransferase YncA